ncbi:helix-turn-helix domain-containing protein [Parabacteroides sp.]
MKLIYTSLLLFCTIVFSAQANVPADKLPQEELSYQSIHSQIISTPEKAIILADSAERLRIIPEHKAHIIRSSAYARLKNEKKALEYALAAFHTDSVQNDSTNYMSVCHMLGNRYIELSRQNEAIDYATRAIRVARSLDNKRLQAQAMVTLSRAQNELAQKEDATKTLEEAIALLQESEDPQDTNVLIKLYFEKIQNLMVMRKTEEAIKTGKKEEALLERIIQTGGIPEKMIDMHFGYLYSILCEAYQLTGKDQEAARYYQKFLATDFARKPQGRTRADRYLLLIKEYKQVIANTLERERLTPAQDSITKDYIVMLRKLKNAYFLMGDYKTAFHYDERIIGIQDKLYARDKKNAAMELAIAYETNEKEAKIIKQKMELRQRNTLLGGALSIITLLILLLWIMYRNNRIIKRKNRITVNQVNQLLSYKNELLEIKRRSKEAKPSNEVTPPKPENQPENQPQLQPEQSVDKDTFNLLEEVMHKEKLYLKPDLTREEILRRLHMDKNRFSRMMQSNSGDNYTNYINNLRLEHSMQLLRQYPHYTLEAIARDSGMGNVRTLHRLFQNKIGMTPTEYKKAL